MSKLPPQRNPDPMAGVVDRLLAQLPGLQGQPEASRNSVTRAPQIALGSTPVRTSSVSPGQVIGTWLRLALGLSLGVMMAGWPYLHTCGMPLFGYLGAVGIVMVTGGWAAAAAWRYRLALAHVVSLTLVLYGLTLAMAELLPRTGYAVQRATWECGESGPDQAWTAAQSHQSGRISS